MARPAKQPVQISIRTYRVGFGDCFLLTFGYADGDERHMLIDFGSMGHSGGPQRLQDIAESIRERCGGKKLHIVAATHRHKDHISGFGHKTAGQIIASLKPDLVLQPWTEDPDIPEDADRPRGARGLQADDRRALAAMSRFAGFYFEGENQDRLKHLEVADKALFARLAFVGEDNVKNLSAVRRLQAMAKAGKGIYLSSEDKVPTGKILPGVTIDVLGPPTPAQCPQVRRQSPTNKAEYWHLRAAAAGAVRRSFPGSTRLQRLI
jgi:hypothetical protein